MNISNMYQIIAEDNFPEIRQLHTGLIWDVSGYEIAEMKIYEERFNEWEKTYEEGLNEREKTSEEYDINEAWIKDSHGLKCAIFDYGGLSVLISLGAMFSKTDNVSFDSPQTWTDRLTGYARLVGKNPSIVLVDEWLGGRRYRRSFWRWQPVEITTAEAPVRQVIDGISSEVNLR